MPRNVMLMPWLVLTSCASAEAGSTTTAASQQRSLERMRPPRAAGPGRDSVLLVSHSHVVMGDTRASRAEGVACPQHLTRTTPSFISSAPGGRPHVGRLPDADLPGLGHQEQAQ